MRLSASLLVLLLPLSLRAQDPAGDSNPRPLRWSGGLLAGVANLEGHFSGAGDASSFQTDLRGDLGHASAETLGGLEGEFRTSHLRFAGFLDEDDASTTQPIPRTITLGKVQYLAGASVHAEVECTTGGLTGGYLFYVQPRAWAAVEAGFQKWNVNVITRGIGYQQLDDHRVPWLSRRATDDNVDAILPSLGLSGGLCLLGKRLNLLASLQLGALDQASSSFLSVQGQFFMLKHFGVRLFAERHTFAMKGDHPESTFTESHFTRQALGLGVMARW